MKLTLKDTCMRGVAAVALLLMQGCRGSYAPHEAVLTLVPTAMRVSGLAAPATGDEHTLCLMAGASAEADVYVARSPITIILIAFTPTPTTIPFFVLDVGSREVASSSVDTTSPKAMVFTAHPDRGEQTLRARVPGTSPGVLCLQQVVVTQR